MVNLVETLVTRVMVHVSVVEVVAELETAGKLVPMDHLAARIAQQVASL